MAEEVISRADARAMGLKRYFTGEPCKSGHIAERGVGNGTCVVCAYEAEKRYKAAHPEKMKEKWRDYERNASEERRVQRRVANKKWAEANPDKVRERGLRWDAANPERKAAHEKKWRDANREHIAAKNKKYKTENADRLRPAAIARAKAWNAANPEVARTTARRRRARKLAIPSDYTTKDLLALLDRQKHRCIACSCKLTLKNRELDHIVAIKNGGPDLLENLQWLCRPCNRSKAAKDPIVWALENGRLL